jgi:predicted TIM-barrel fold metal-dependent hydrolase
MTAPEPALDPQQRIVDAHHHLYDRPGARYLVDEFLADLRGGHRVEATVYVQARHAYRPAGPELLKPVGETEFASAVARTRSGSVSLCAGIVGFADLGAGAAAHATLDAHLAADPLRFRGVRQIACWDADASLTNPAYPATHGLLAEPRVREGFAGLAPRGLTFDAWLYFPQLPHLASLARAFPGTGIVMNHCGGVLGVGRYAARRDEVRTLWLAHMRALAQCPNVCVKLGGLGMATTGLDLPHRPDSAILAEAWTPWMEPLIEAFGTRRCMFESNFPADRVSYDYAVGWNAMKRIASRLSDSEKADLFWRTASRFYRLGEDTSR